MTEKQIKELNKIVSHQAEMESLWPGVFPSLHLALMGAALRHLHAVIENDWVTAQKSKDVYWELESEL